MRRARLGLLVLALPGPVAALLFACASDRSFADTTTDAAPDVASLPPPGVGADAAPADAADDWTVPDGAVACADASPCVLSLSGAAGTFCALRADGKVACWGAGYDGQLGYDAGDGVQTSATPRTLGGIDGVTSVDVGDGNACATTGDGGVYCWGNADLVNAGITPTDGGTPLDSPVAQPTKQTAVASAARIGVGTHTACATTSAGGLVCWGQNQSQELGRGPTADPLAPPGAANLAGKSVTVARLAASRSFALTAAGELLSWGASNSTFLVGRDTSEDPDGVPAIVPLPQVRALANGQSHSCAIAGRFVSCWGTNESGQLGRGTFDYQGWLPDITRLAFTIEAEDLDAGAGDTHDVALSVAAGAGHSCVAMGSGRVYCWGANSGGQLGTRNTATVSGYPTRITDLDGPAVQLAAGGGASCALLRSGEVECWGTNYNGELGRGAVDQLPHPRPQQVHFAP